MAHGVTTDHVLYTFGADIMTVFDTQTRAEIVTATRQENNTWLVHADGADDVTVGMGEGEKPRAPVVAAMLEHALAVSPKTGYSTLVPPGVREMS